MKKILILAPHLSCLGGIVSVVKNILEYENEKFVFKFHPVRRDGNKIFKILYIVPCILTYFYKLCFSKVDIVHIHVSEYYGYFRYIPFMIVSKLLNKPYILHMHGGRFCNFFEGLKWKFPDFIKKTMCDADCLICLSYDMKDYLSSLGINNIAVIHNSVPLQKTNTYCAESKNILFIGKVSDKKGLFDLLMAMQYLKNSIDIKLDICGEGNIKKLNELIETLELKNNVEFHGWVVKEKKEKIFKKASLLVLPSYFEAFPMVLIEAMSYGIPIISTNVGGIPEIITSKNGILVKPGEIIQLASEITNLINDKQKRMFMSEQNFLKVKNCYSIEASLSKLFEVYNCVLSKK